MSEVPVLLCFSEKDTSPDVTKMPLGSMPWGRCGQTEGNHHCALSVKLSAGAVTI
jgi:hypothetical protein